MEGEKGSYQTVPHGAPNCRKGKRNKVLPDWATGAYLQKGKRDKKVHAGQGDTGFLIANKEKGKVCPLAGPHRVPTTPPRGNCRKGKGKRVLLDQATLTL